MELLIVLLGLLALDALALRCGADSREPWDSPEWARRKAWRGFGA